jgi:hypothetical protein
VTVLQGLLFESLGPIEQRLYVVVEEEVEA